MASKSGSVIEMIADHLAVNVKFKHMFKRSYDDWTIRQYFSDRKRRFLVDVQKILVDEHAKYGSDLACSRFVVGRMNGQIQDLQGAWIRRKKDLPPEYSKDFRVGAIKIANNRLVSEGIDNFVGLDFLEYFDLSGNPDLDDFACDQLGRLFRRSKTLKQINLSFNPLISVYGLESLMRIPSLREVVAYDTLATKYENIDLFALSAEDEKQCRILVHRDGRQFNSPELEALRTGDRSRRKPLLAEN